MQQHTDNSQALEQLARTESYLAVDPGNKDLLARAVDQALDAHAIERAEAHALAALARYPGDPFFRYRHAHVLNARRQWGEAAAIYADLLSTTSDANVACSLAHCYSWLGQHQAALDTLAPFAGLPGDAVTVQVRAMHHAGVLDQAIALIDREHERLAGHAPFLAAASLVFLDSQDTARAAAFSDAALALAPASVEGQVVRATLALADADSDTAIAQFQQVLAAHPEEGRSWSGLGMASLLKRDLGNASAQLEQALKYMPGHIGTWHSLAWCKVFGGDLAGAEASFLTALELDRNFGESHGGMAVVAALRGDRTTAQAALERALRLDRNSLAARYAQLVLSGETADPDRFRALAFKFMAAHKTASGERLSDVVKRHVQS